MNPSEPANFADARDMPDLPNGANVLLAFSGGIDSTLAAYLCKNAGFQVLAVYLRLLPGRDPELDSARRTADSIGIPLTSLDLQEDFRNTVMRLCWEQYRAGKTPNPCVLCNPAFKFGRLLQFARDNDCRSLVTGHYARLRRAPGGHVSLLKGVHAEKDQSYFLHGLSEEQRAFSAFPLGSMTKDAVRSAVRALNLPNAEKRESQDACFAPKEGSMPEFLRTCFGGSPRPGVFVSRETGAVLGRHNGIHSFTIGQRKGTGVALGHPAYVCELSPDGNRVMLSDDPASLLKNDLAASHVNFLEPDLFPVGVQIPCEVRIRYRSAGARALATRLDDNRVNVHFESPQRAITPGQAAVGYDGERVLFGGTIQG